jgi:hypothetical protein
MNSANQRRRFYLYAMFLTGFVTMFDGWDMAQISNQTWLQWLVDCAKILVPVFVADRAFLDQSLSRSTKPEEKK